MAEFEYEEREFDAFYRQWLEENGHIFEDSEHSDREETHSNPDDDRDMAPVALIGSLTPFKPDQESFGDFISRFEEFCDLNEDFMGEDAVRRERKTKLLLLNHLPVEVRSTLSRLTGQDEPKTRPLEELKTKLRNHFNPPTLALNAVRKFQKLQQTPTESVNDFILKLRSVAKDCDYGTELDKKLHTQLSLGLKSDRAVDQISLQGLYHPVTNNFDTACEIANSQETLEAERLERRMDREEMLNQVNKTARGRFKSQLQQPSTSSGRGFSRGNGQSFRGGRGDFNNSYQPYQRGGGRGDFRGRGAFNNQNNQHQYAFKNQNNQHQYNPGTSNMPFNRGGSHRGSRGGNPGRNQGIPCWRCGRQECNPDKCWARNAQCYQCNGFGHAKYYHRRNVNALVQNNNNGPKGNPQMNQELGPDEQAANFVSNFDVETVFVNKVMTAQEVPYEEIYLEDNPDGFEELTKMYDEEKYQLFQEASKVEETVQEEIRSNSVEVVQEENKPEEISLANPILEEYVKKKEEKKIKIQQVEDKISEALQEGKQVYFVGINSITKQPAHIVEIWMNGKKLKMEADTGSGVTLIAETLFRRLFPELKLKSSNVFLTTLSAPLTVIGAAEVNVPDAKGQLLKLRLLVCRATLEFHPLLGRDWMDVLIPNWRERFQIEQNPGLVQVVKEELPEEIQKIIQKYPEVFSEDRSKSIAGFEAKIVVKPNPKFVCHKEYDLPYSARSIVSDQLRQEVQEGRLIHVEKSEAGVASPLWPIPKSNGQFRLCVDYKRTLNPNLVIDYYPLPKPEDLFNSLAGCTIFSVLDMSEAYLQIVVAEECRKYLVISTHLGYFMPTRLMFGIASAPAIFQQFIDDLTRDLPFVRGYLDDIIIGARSKEEMLKTISRLLERLQGVNARVKLDKCSWLQSETEYLGFQINASGLKVSPIRVKPILEARLPENTSELRAFLGMVNFYRRFIPNCSTMLAPLNALLADKTPWVWTEECTKAVKNCKQALTASNVLTLYDPNKELVLVCDASPYGLGCVISHRIGTVEHPISFASATLTETQKRYSQIDREALGIIFGLTKFYKYLAGREFVLVTDNLPLRWLLDPNKPMPMMTAARVQRWSMILRSFNYKIEYRPSAEMGAADMLSRLAVSTAVEELVHVIMPVIGSMPLNAEMIAEETKKNEELLEVIKITRGGWPEKMDTQHKAYAFFKLRLSLSIEGECLMLGERVVIPKSLQPKILDLLHGGHPGVVRMKMRARMSVYWPKIDEDIEDFVRNCEACAQFNFKAISTATGRWPITSAPWMRLHLDFFYFKTVTVLILVDSFSKWLEVWPVTSTTAEQVISKLRISFSYFGLPIQIVSDNGPPFTSIEFLDFCSANGILASKSPPYHPQSNGQAEIVVKITKMILKKLSITNPSDDLNTKILNMLMNYRSTPSTVTGLTPSQVMLTFQPRHKLSLLSPRVEHDKSYQPISRVFLPGERVKILLKKGEQGKPGKIMSQLGAFIYIVELDGIPTLCHVNQLSSNVPDEKTGPEATGSQTNSSPVPQEKKTSELQEELRRSTRANKGVAQPKLNLKVDETAWGGTAQW